jgi:hypothetical protein
MKHLISAIAAALVLAALFAPATSFANPYVSEWTHEVEYDQDACVRRAGAAFAQEGWAHIEVQSKYVTLADKGKLSGIIVCLYESDSQAIAVVFVAGGAEGVAASESETLKTDLK